MIHQDKEIEELCKRANEINANNLKEILRDNQNTKFGKSHHFERIDDFQSYRENVPLSTYENYQLDVKSMMAGEQNVLTVYPVVNYVKTSGSEGTPKYIPVSEEALRRYSNYIERYKNAVFKQVGGKRFWVSIFRTDLKKTTAQTQILSVIAYRNLEETQKLVAEDYVGGFGLLFQENSQGSLYAKVYSAFLEENVTLIESIFLYDQLIFFQYMEKYWKEILDDIENGRISSKWGVSSELQEVLRQIPIDKQRLKRVRSACEEGFEGIALRIWPKLYLASGIGNQDDSSEGNTLKKYLMGVPIHYFAFVASECHMGVALEAENNQFVVLSKSAFYEYIPYEEQNQTIQCRTLLPHELEIGKMYEVVLTNFSGFYRYQLGDIVRVKGFYYESPQIEFVFRKNQILNIAGEKMGIHQVERVAKNLNQRLAGEIEQYSVCVYEKQLPKRYLFVCSGRGLLQEDQVAQRKFVDYLDEEFQAINIDYADLRKMKYIEKPEVMILEHEEYENFMKENGYRNGHNKVQHIAMRGFSNFTETGMEE